ncbi:hypothetical protein [Fibrella forsythiae]|uniref:Uncharacterized protein n=1 Tax=Fibrella forsythiae TaxID=2817061 RepID=A0ABS3JBB9_9BACT|nr:hypothetical protein [Fibrella forsythiae]MBO0947284.1 hypothetical protein [Fibrella forsythiae]
MALSRRFNDSFIKEAFAQEVRRVHAVILRMLSYVGELCVNEARSLNTYQDQTGNLRASVGYLILYNGVVLKSDFGEGVGGSTGERVARDVAGQYPSGWVLIVVAGMAYAADVESRGLDVLTSAEQLAKQIVPGLIADLRKQLAAR